MDFFNLYTPIISPSPQKSKILECPVAMGCSFETKSFSTLQRHCKIEHNFELKIKCPWPDCEYAAFKKHHLKSHLQSHSNDKPFTCHVCKKYSARHKSSLDAHLRTHHTEDVQFECIICQFRCKTSQSLQVHIRSHTKIKPFKCNECSLSFKTHNQLLLHNRRHIKWKPYVCTFNNECLFRAASHSEIKRHIELSHLGIKRFACEHCSSRLSTSHALKKHMERHETQKSFEYVCKLIENGIDYYKSSQDGLPCTIRCKTSLDLEYHILRNHTKEGIQAKFYSETRLADFFKSNNIVFDRDWSNNISFRTCRNIEGLKSYARPDFRLIEYEEKLQCIVLVGNDEFAHRQYACDLQRIFNISNALEQTEEFHGVPLLYIRFNPHGFTINEQFFNPPLEQSHELLLSILNNLTQQDIKPGVNLIYINYDQNTNGIPSLFDEQDNDFVQVFKPCIIKVV